jgi:hypothetical protein
MSRNVQAWRCVPLSCHLALEDYDVVSLERLCFHYTEFSLPASFSWHIEMELCDETSHPSRMFVSRVFCGVPQLSFFPHVHSLISSYLFP